MPRELAKMASKWCIDGVFSDMLNEKFSRGQVFTRVGLPVNLYSVSWLSCVDKPTLPAIVYFE